MISHYFKNKPDLSISVIIHFVLFLVLVLFFVIKSCSKDKDIYVFEIVDTPSETQPAPVIQKKSKPKPKPKEMKPIKPMNYEQFLKENPRPRVNVADTHPKVKPLPDFEYKVGKIESVKQSTPLNATLLQEYQRSVYSTISSAWNKPRNSTGADLTVRVQFTILSDGTIQYAKIIASSGSQSFDQSILDVFDKISRFNPTPSSRKETFSMNFRVSG